MLIPFVTDFSQEIKMIGAVAFIRVLLLIAGVEPNPGPLNQTFVFRYQYLLIEVGTEVMQKLFDDVIETDFGTYLATNMTAAIKLQWLIDTGKITRAQQNYLPPIDTKPMSANFDITLLSCLLRNVCGLRPFKDVVWMNPASTDHSREADVTRLRECRNNVAHMRTVYISDTDLAVKWTELTEILKRLNSCHSNGVTDLTSKIYQTGCMDIDDNLRERYDTRVEQWKEMEQLYDQGFSDLQQGQTEIKQGLTEIKQGLLVLQQGQFQLQKDAQKDHEKKMQEMRDTQQAAKLENEIDIFVYRYQYLLVEIGTYIMRKIFDVLVGPDFVRHLSANNNRFNRILQNLILEKIITADQAQYLPLIDNSPKSTNMDITLLACLLRNVCGLRSQNDPVWKNPPPTDLSLEADLTRLKECRNNLQHRSTVFITEVDLTVLWKDLCRIMYRLNNVSKITNLTSLINDAEVMEIDKELQKRFDQAIKAWTEMDILLDCGIEELKLAQSELVEGQSEIVKNLSNLNMLPDLKKSLANVESGLKEQAERQKEQAEIMQEISNRTKRLVEQTPCDCKGRGLDMDESVPPNSSVVQPTAHSVLTVDAGAAVKFTRQLNSIIQLLKTEGRPVLAKDVAQLTNIGKAASDVNRLLYFLEKKSLIRKTAGAKPSWEFQQDVCEDDLKIFGGELANIPESNGAKNKRNPSAAGQACNCPNAGRWCIHSQLPRHEFKNYNTYNNCQFGVVNMQKNTGTNQTSALNPPNPEEQ